MKKIVLLTFITCAVVQSISAMDLTVPNKPEDNLGYLIGANSELASAVMLNSEYVLTAAHTSLIYTPEIDQIFVKGNKPFLLTHSMETGLVEFEKSLKLLDATQITYCRYDTIYLPQKVVCQARNTTVDIADIQSISAVMKNLFNKQNNIKELLREDQGIDGFTYPEGDWAILKLKTAIPVQPLRIQKFSPQELSGMNSVCLGMQTEVIRGKTLFTKISSRKIDVQPQYHAERNVFISTVQTNGAQDDTGFQVDLPNSIITNGMSGGPLVFKYENNWVLGGIVSRNLSDTMLVILNNVTEDPQQSLTMSQRQGIKKIIGFHMDRKYPVHSLYASLDGLYEMCLKLNIL